MQILAAWGRELLLRLNLVQVLSLGAEHDRPRICSRRTLEVHPHNDSDTAANYSSAGANHAEAANSDEVLDSGAEEASQDKMR